VGFTCLPFSSLVSIHAPARGATTFLTRQDDRHLVSIHAPARGATSYLTGCQDWVGSFNPRTREGCDLGTAADFPDHPTVSIHAPARGATKMISLETAKALVSIHAPARGATQKTRKC